MQGYFPAKVIKNNDTKKKGRVQVKIEHLHYGIADKELPWAIQSNSGGCGGSNLHGSSFIPEVNSFVWVWFEDIDEFQRQPYYISDINFSDFHPHTLFQDNVKSSIGSASVYPNAKYTYYPNGICIGVDSNSSNAEIFIYHPTASIFIDKNGKVKIKATEIELLGGTVPSEKMVLGKTLSDTLGAILDAIAAITVTCTAPGSPSSVPVNAAAFTLIKTVQLPTILSAKNKNN